MPSGVCGQPLTLGLYRNGDRPLLTHSAYTISSFAQNIIKKPQVSPALCLKNPRELPRPAEKCSEAHRAQALGDSRINLMQLPS